MAASGSISVSIIEKYSHGIFFLFHRQFNTNLCRLLNKVARIPMIIVDKTELRTL